MVGAVAARPDAAPGWPLVRSPPGDQWGVVADPDRGALAGSAELVRELEGRLLTTSSLVRRWHVGVDPGSAPGRVRRRRRRGVDRRDRLERDPRASTRRRSPSPAAEGHPRRAAGADDGPPPPTPP